MPEQTSRETWVLTTEDLDAIRLDAQTADPESNKEFQDVVVEAYEIFVAKFGPLFTEGELISTSWHGLGRW